VDIYFLSFQGMSRENTILHPVHVQEPEVVQDIKNLIIQIFLIENPIINKDLELSSLILTESNMKLNHLRLFLQTMSQ